MSQVAIDRLARQRRSRAAFASGVLAVLVFVGVGFTLGGISWLVAAALGAVAVVLGVAARRAREPEGRLALAGIVLGGVIVVWFVAYIVVDALS